MPERTAGQLPKRPSKKGVIAAQSDANGEKRRSSCSPLLIVGNNPLLDQWKWLQLDRPQHRSLLARVIWLASRTPHRVRHRRCRRTNRLTGSQTAHRDRGVAQIRSLSIGNVRKSFNMSI